MNEHTAIARSHRPEQTGVRGGQALLLEVLGDRNLVFSEAQQAVYELSDIAAHAWRSLNDGMSEAQALDDMVTSGIDREQAADTLRAVRLNLESVGAEVAEPPVRASPDRSHGFVSLSIVIADVAVQLHLSRTLVSDVLAVFGHFITDLSEADYLLCAKADGSAVDVFSPGQPDWSCRRAQFIPLLKAQLVEVVLRHASYEVALHAAALAGKNEAILLLGSPGAGKTTLSIALTKAGLELLADDITLLNRDGFVTGIPFPFTAKSSSWPLLSRSWPGIANHASHQRPDGKTVRYIPHGFYNDQVARPIGLVLILNRKDGACTSVEPTDQTDALSALIAEGATRDERLGSTGFAALLKGLRGARCYRLTYSDLEEAAKTVCRLDR